MPARFSRTFLLSLFLLVSFSSGAAKDPEWVEGHSPHFHIYSNAKPKQAEETVQKLEAFRYLISQLLTKLRLDPPVPTTVLLFKNTKTLHPYVPLTPDGKPKKLAGFFAQSQDRMYLVVDLSSSNSAEVSFHEYLHLLLALNVQTIPLWLDEGLAMFYERTDIEGTRFTMGFPQEDRWGALQQSKLIPLEVLVEVDHDSPYYNVPDKQQLFYGEAWALVHYLMVGEKGQRQAQLGQFVDLLRRGLPQADAFKKAFGEDYPSMQKKLQSYVHQSTMNAYQGKLRQAIEKATVTMEPVETALVEAHLSDLWINSGRLDEAEAALKKLAAAGGAVIEVQFRLGRIALSRRQPGEAAGYFRAALSEQPDDITLRYYAALALTLHGASDEDDGERVNEIVNLLSPILEQKSDFPDAYELLVQMRQGRNDPPEEMIPLLERVRDLAPQKRDFDLMLAFNYMKAERLDEAESLLQAIINNSTQMNEVAQAKEWLGQIRQMREWAKRRQQFQEAQQQSESPPPQETRPRQQPQVNYPVEPLSAAPAAPALRVEYLRGTLVHVECADDAAVITVVPESKKKDPAAQPVHLAVRSRSRLIVIDSTDNVKSLDCDAAGVPVGVNYTVQADGPSIAGVAMTIEFFKLPR